MGEYLGSVECLHHKESKPSMAIYKEDSFETTLAPGTLWVHADSYSYYCFGCHASGHLEEQEALELLENLDISRQNRKPSQRIGNLVVPCVCGSWLEEERGIERETYLRYGVMEDEKGDENSEFLYLPCYDYNKTQVGYQVRRLYSEESPKIWSVPDTKGNYPKYSWVYGWSMMDEYTNICLVESIIDGLSLYSKTRIPSLAVLGTNISNDVYRTLNDNLYKDYHKVSVIFDPDSPGRSAQRKLVDKLRVVGYDVRSISLDSKIYEVDSESLEEILGI